MILVLWRRKSRQKSSVFTSNGGAKCRWHRLNAGAVAEKLATFDAKRCQLSSVASLLHWAFTWFVCSTFAVMQCITRQLENSLNGCVVSPRASCPISEHWSLQKINSLDFDNSLKVLMSVTGVVVRRSTHSSSSASTTRTRSFSSCSTTPCSFSNKKNTSAKASSGRSSTSVLTSSQLLSLLKRHTAAFCSFSRCFQEYFWAYLLQFRYRRRDILVNYGRPME